MKRYHDLNSELRKIFGEKIIKLSLDGGFSCPNRQTGPGCYFCSYKGSGEFAASRKLNIKEQVAQQIDFQSKKWSNGKYVAYFGTYTSTYSDVSYLSKVYDEALACEGIVGLAIATRPDCISDDVLDLLEKYSNKTFLWIELGLQTIHDQTHILLNTGYDRDIFERIYFRLVKSDIRVVSHLMLNLPDETKDMMLESVTYLNSLKPWGIKFHMLYILKNTPLYEMYSRSPFNIMSFDEYTSFIVGILELLDKDIVIHRLTGDPPRKDLFLPTWSINKRLVIQTIEKKQIELDSFQGKEICDRI